MAGKITSQVSIPMNMGDTYVITIPVTPLNQGGFWPTKEDGYQNGFKLVDEKAGEITVVSKDKLSIEYKHKIAGINTIIFKSLTGDTLIISAGSIMVHDHATIRTGGPAYGTYFTEQKAT